MWNLVPWGQLVNGVFVGVGAAVTQHAAQKVQFPERLIAFGKAVFPELTFGAPATATPETPPIVRQAEAAASADAADQAAAAKLAEIEAQRRAEQAAAEAAAAKAKADAAAKAAGGTKRCVCLTTGEGIPRLSLGGAAGPSDLNVGCADDHLCDKCTLNHVTEAAKRSPILSDVELDVVAMAVPGEVFAREAPVMPMPPQPFDEEAYQVKFDLWGRSRQAWQRHQPTVGAVADDLIECQKVANERGRQSLSCSQQLEEARAALEAELQAIAQIGPSVGQAIDVERQRRGLRTLFSGISVGEAPTLSTSNVPSSSPALIQCQMTLADINIRTQACEAELPKVRAALKVAQARRQELSAKSQSSARAAAERAALDAQAAKAAAERAERAQRAAEQTSQVKATTPAMTVQTPFGPVTFPPQAAPAPAASPPAPAAAPAMPAMPAWSFAEDDVLVNFRTSSEQSASRGREGDFDLEAEIEEVGTTGEYVSDVLRDWLSASSGDFFPLAPPSATVVGAGMADPSGCGCG